VTARVSGRLFRPAVCLALLSLVALVLRLWHLDYQSLWRDEADAVYFATQPLPDLLHMFTSDGDNGPLYFLSLRGWIALFGRSEAAVRGFSLLPGVLLVPVVGVLGRRIAGARAGICASAFAALSPYLVWYSQEAKMYSWVALLGTLSLLGLVEGLRHGRTRDWALYVAAGTVALWMHILAVLLIPAGLAVKLLWRPSSRARARGYWVSLAALTLPYVPLAWWQARAFAAAFHTGRPFVPLAEVVASLFVGWTNGVQPTFPLLGLLVALFLALAAWMSPAEGEPNGVIALTSWLLLPVAALFIISLRTPLFNERYLIYGAPALYLLMGCGVAAARSRWRVWTTTVVAIALLVFATGVWTQGTRLIKADWRGTAAFVHGHQAPDDAVMLLLPQAVHAFDYYYRESYLSLPAVKTNDLAQPSEAARALASATEGRRAVWLVLSDEAAWDTRGWVAEWFRAEWTLDAEASLVRVHVMRFVR
jgi:mannosyltransferase